MAERTWGGIEADLTVTRLTQDQYLIVTAAASQGRDFYWLRNRIPPRLSCSVDRCHFGLERVERDGAAVKSIVTTAQHR